MESDARPIYCPRLKVHGPNGLHTVVELGGVRIAVGREPSWNDVVLEPDPDGIVSREHCVLERRDHAWHVADCSSRNGTFLLRAGAMEPVRWPIPLVDGDVIRIHARRGAAPRYWELAFEDPHRTQPLLDPPRGARVVFDREAQTLYVVNGGPPAMVAIRRQERLLLTCMAEANERNGGQPVICGHAALIQAVWADQPLHDSDDVTSLIASLRKKVRLLAQVSDREFIETVRGGGYMLHAATRLLEDLRTEHRLAAEVQEGATGAPGER
jgi:DNA-binding winged helix-turn-helix (wHTH) protein